MLQKFKEDLVNKIQKNGVINIEEFLDEENLKSVKKILNKDINIKGTRSSFFYRSRKNFLLKKLINFEFINYLDCLKLINLSKKLKLKELSSNILSRQTKLFSIDSYYSEVSTNRVLDWHVDQAYSGNLSPKNFLDPNHAALKYFVYLTDVSSNNGCLGYIPGSHKILYFLKFGILDGTIKYKPYWRLEDLRKIVQDEHYNGYLQTKINKELIDEFLDKTSFISNSPHDTQKYDYALKAGSALIFDEAGVHRGAETSKTSRLVMRFTYKDIKAPD